MARQVDDTIRCEVCHSPLRYDKFIRQWIAIDLYPEASKCKQYGSDTNYYHTPKGNVGRLLRALRRWESRKLRVD